MWWGCTQIYLCSFVQYTGARVTLHNLLSSSRRSIIFPRQTSRRHRRRRPPSRVALLCDAFQRIRDLLDVPLQRAHVVLKVPELFERVLERRDRRAPLRRLAAELCRLRLQRARLLLDLLLSLERLLSRSLL